MRQMQPLCGLLAVALLLAHAPALSNAQGASAGGLAEAPAAGAGAAAGAGDAAGPALSAQSIASSMSGGSLGSVQTGRAAGHWTLRLSLRCGLDHTACNAAHAEQTNSL